MNVAWRCSPLCPKPTSYSSSRNDPADQNYRSSLVVSKMCSAAVTTHDLVMMVRMPSSSTAPVAHGHLAQSPCVLYSQNKKIAETEGPCIGFWFRQAATWYSPQVIHHITSFHRSNLLDSVQFPTLLTIFSLCCQLSPLQFAHIRAISSQAPIWLQQLSVDTRYARAHGRFRVIQPKSFFTALLWHVK
ncbi:hypothetical protein IF2G_01032 [Cordyceps javanica]|nr:hypothetical protein IF2G_01032 [Cordyceps javanica]